MLRRVCKRTNSNWDNASSFVRIFLSNRTIFELACVLNNTLSACGSKREMATLGFELKAAGHLLIHFLASYGCVLRRLVGLDRHLKFSLSCNFYRSDNAQLLKRIFVTFSQVNI